VAGRPYTPLEVAARGEIVWHRNPPGVPPFGLHFHGVLKVAPNGDIERLCEHQHASEDVALRCHKKAPG
jgi:hypothetical protein